MSMSLNELKCQLLLDGWGGLDQLEVSGCWKGNIRFYLNKHSKFGSYIYEKGKYTFYKKDPTEAYEKVTQRYEEEKQKQAELVSHAARNDGHS